MRWLGMLSGVLTLAAVILNILWFQRFGGIAPGALLRFSIPTVLLLFLFLGAVFLFGRLSARLMVQAGGSGDEEEEAEPGAAHPSDKPDDPSS